MPQFRRISSPVAGRRLGGAERLIQPGSSRFDEARQRRVFHELPLSPAKLSLGRDQTPEAVRQALDAHFYEITQSFSPSVARALRETYEAVIRYDILPDGAFRAGSMTVRVTPDEPSGASYGERLGRTGAVYDIALSADLADAPIAVRKLLIHELLHIGHRMERRRQVGLEEYVRDNDAVHRFTEMAAAFTDKGLFDAISPSIHAADVPRNLIERESLVQFLTEDHANRRSLSPLRYLEEKGKSQIEVGVSLGGGSYRYRDADLSMFLERLRLDGLGLSRRDNALGEG